ncbi:hypothetical protein [Streptomyces sp. NPDC047061]|uniref:hypothetical protein n=1 Tax=Streptomyces sp. NPDC047061 TaxID=3154605 RepID=UPI0033FCDF00
MASTLAAGCSTGIDLLGMFGDPIGTMMHMVANSVMAGALGMFKALQSTIGSYNTDSSDKIGAQTHWVVVYLAVGSLLFAAIKMAFDRRGEAGHTALKGMLRVIVVTAASTTVIVWFADLMEAFANYLLQKSLDNVLGGITCTNDVPAALLLIIACLLIIAGVIHTILLWIRLGVMIVLMGTFPMAAAASMADWGTTWWRKHLGWMLAWLLYKPTVGLMMYAGSIMVYNAQKGGSGNASADAINTQIAGMGVLLLSAIALPALMRLVVPAVGSLGTDASGAATLGAAGAIASGAKSVADGAIGRLAASGSKKSTDTSDTSDGGGPHGSRDGDSTQEGSTQGGSGGGQQGGQQGGGEGQSRRPGGGDGGHDGGDGGDGGDQAASSTRQAAAAGLSGVLAVAALAARTGSAAADVARSAVDERADPEDAIGGRHGR